jgi:anti-sigma B factor antagonist
MRLADIQFRSHGDAMIARVTGEIDLSNAGQIGAALERGTPNHVHALVLDFTGIDYLDSAGIQLIYRLRERVRARGLTLTLVISKRSPSHDALRLAGVTGHVMIVPTVDEALADVERCNTVADPGAS